MMIAQACELFPVAHRTYRIGLRAGYSEYPLDDRIIEIHSVACQTSSTATPYKLTPFEVSFKDKEESGWRNIGGNPTEYGIYSNDVQSLLMTYPQNRTESSGGYPCLIIEARTSLPTLATNDPVPYLGGYGRSYIVAGACERFCRDLKKDECGFWMQVKAVEEDKVAEFFNGRNDEQRPRIWIQRGKMGVA